MVAIQVRDVPDDVRDALAAEADARGRAWFTRMRDSPIAWIEARIGTAELIREQRKERTEHLLDVTSEGTPAR